VYERENREGSVVVELGLSLAVCRSETVFGLNAIVIVWMKMRRKVELEQLAMTREALAQRTKAARQMGFRQFQFQKPGRALLRGAIGL